MSDAVPTGYWGLTSAISPAAIRAGLTLPDEIDAVIVITDAEVLDDGLVDGWRRRAIESLQAFERVFVRQRARAKVRYRYAISARRSESPGVGLEHAIRGC
jgi:hypothetical protein